MEALVIYTKKPRVFRILSKTRENIEFHSLSGVDFSINELVWNEGYFKEFATEISIKK